MGAVGRASGAAPGARLGGGPARKEETVAAGAWTAEEPPSGGWSRLGGVQRQVAAGGDAGEAAGRACGQRLQVREAAVGLGAAGEDGERGSEGEGGGWRRRPMAERRSIPWAAFPGFCLENVASEVSGGEVMLGNCCQPGGARPLLSSKKLIIHSLQKFLQFTLLKACCRSSVCRAGSAGAWGNSVLHWFPHGKGPSQDTSHKSGISS